MAKCCAPNCMNNQKKNSAGCNFYEFPENPILRRKWISNIGRPNWSPGRRSILCSAHFEESQVKKKGQQIILDKDAIPTLFQTPRKKNLKKSEGTKNSESSEDQKTQLSSNTKQAATSSQSTKYDKMCINKAFISGQNSRKDICNSKVTSALDALVVDGALLISDYEVAGDTEQSQKPHMNCNIATEEQTSSSDANYQLGNRSSSHEESLGFNDKNSLVYDKAENLVSSPILDTSCKMYLITENHNSNSVNVKFNQQPSVKQNAACKPVLDLSDIARPFYAETEASVFPGKDHTIIVPPFKKRKLSESDISLLPKANESTENLEEISASNEPNQFIQKGVIKLPVSLTCHNWRKNSSTLSEGTIKWQTGTYMCRLCGIASNKTINLFSTKANEKNLLARISSILPIKIVPNDDLPQHICFSCLNSLDSCSELIVSSFRTHRQLASVMGQDVHESSNLSVFFHESERKNYNMNWQRHILLMEIMHEQDKPLQEYLSIAYNDLQMRLSSEVNEIEKPQCSLLLASLTNSCAVSEIEQARTAAEALICKTLIHNEINEQEDQPIFEYVITGEDELCSDSDNVHTAIQVEDDCDAIGSQIVPDNVTNVKSMSLFESKCTSQHLPNDVQVMPVVDDASSIEYFPLDNKCSAISQIALEKRKTFENMQRFFSWHLRDDKTIKLGCRLCNTYFGQLANFHQHLDCHIDSESSKKDPTGIISSQLSQKEIKYQKTEYSMITKGTSHRYQCSLCSEHFPLRSSLKSHLQDYHETNAKCEGCGHESSDVCEASSHRKICNKFKKENEWQCRKCLEFFSTEKKLQKHQTVTGHHTEAITWTCDICGKRYSQPAKLNQHKKSHLPAEFKYIHQCSHCPKRYINSSRLREHMQKHEEKKYMCKVCGKLFSTKQILKQHEFTHGEPQFLCSLCSRTFFRKSHLVKHMNVHNPENTRASRAGPQPHRDGLNRCRECKKVFDQNNLLDHYKRCHPNISLENYVCEICKEENTSYAELYQHQREVHKTGVKDCPFCDKTIDSSTQMKYHLMRHEGMFPYNCPLCSNGYTANSVLQDHIRRKHTGEKPFECQQCLKRFPTNGALAQHSTVHSLPHQLLPCPICNQGFKRKAHLDVHIRTHTGEKPYPCPICDRPFRQRPDCVKHIRVIHGEDPSKFDIRFHPNMGVTFPQVVSVADMELILEGEDLMQASLEANQLNNSQQ